MAQFDGKYITSYLMAIVMFALPLIIYEIFANKTKCVKFTLKMKVTAREEKNETCVTYWK